MLLQQSFSRSALRQVQTAAFVVALLGVLSLLVAFRAWSVRRYLDLQLTIGLIDSLVVLGLAYALARNKVAAAWALIVLAVAGAVYTLREGRPVLAIVPQLITILFVGRAIVALRFLRNSAGSREA